ncbi:MAG: hypothetical protein JWN34_722 [Bryobacterales bacterium]|jgi:hypothetical protein|nr:hypothetical protein [Bryobacterales bacterium]
MGEKRIQRTVHRRRTLGSTPKSRPRVAAMERARAMSFRPQPAPEAGAGCRRSYCSDRVLCRQSEPRLFTQGRSQPIHCADYSCRADQKQLWDALKWHFGRLIARGSKSTNTANTPYNSCSSRSTLHWALWCAAQLPGGIPQTLSCRNLPRDHLSVFSPEFRKALLAYIFALTRESHLESLRGGQRANHEELRIALGKHL